MEKLIITAAICGAEVTKEHNENVPYTVTEIADEAFRAYKSGASIIHLHVREDDGTPTQNVKRFYDCIIAIRKLCPDVIIQPSTGGAAGMSNEERLQPLTLRPEMATLDCGTLNFGGDTIFVNTENTIKDFANQMFELGVKPELEVFDRSMVNAALRIAKEGLISMPLHFNLVMGINGGIGASLEEVSFLINSLPSDATYTLSGVGRHEFNLAAIAAITGGHVRVGFEDNIYLSKGVKAKSNGELVEKAAKIGRLLGREIAAPDEAREILGLK
jgi:3-keto-5-aminohexanoate cleavage enzyme